MILAARLSPNKRIEFAPFGRPTRKQLYCCRLIRGVRSIWTSA